MQINENDLKILIDHIDWNDICNSGRKLTEEFIEKFQDKVNWTYISKHQKLSERFIERHQDKVDWYYISRNQYLYLFSKDFRKKYKLNKYY